MKTIITSDLHLTTKFEPAKFNYLRKVIEQADRVIINGDFWSYYSCTFEQFINSQWNRLFPVLKSKNTVYIYGNHDEEIWCGDCTEFSDIQSYEYDLKVGEHLYKVQHGHRLCLSKPINNEKYMRVERKLHVDDLIRYPLESWIIKRLGLSKYQRLTRSMQIELKKYALQHMSENEVLITGHSHHGEVDFTDKFANCGFIGSGIAEFIILDSDVDVKSLELKKESY